MLAEYLWLRDPHASDGGVHRRHLYKAHPISKTSDADMENASTRLWIDVAVVCEYISNETREDLTAEDEETNRMLSHMIEGS